VYYLDTRCNELNQFSVFFLVISKTSSSLFNVLQAFGVSFTHMLSFLAFILININ